MPRATPILTSFNAGEWDPELWGSFDLAKYGNACRVLENFIAKVRRAAARRPGTHFVAPTKGTPEKAARLIDFVYSVVQAYVIEATDLAFRFYKDRALIEITPGNPVTVVTPWLEAQLAALKWTQSNDVLFLCHGSHAPRTLTRSSHVNWTLAPFGNVDGPYGEQNVTPATLTPSAASGNGITITAGPAKAITGAADNGSGLIRITSAAHGWTTGMRLRITGVVGTTEANGVWTITRIGNTTYDLQGSAFVNAYTSGGSASPALFAATDATAERGRLVRIKNGATWGYAEIVGFTNESVVTADVVSAFAAITAATTWRLGAWSDTTGWPTVAEFFQERLWFARGQTVWGSRSGDFTGFAPTELDGTVLDDSAVTYTLADDEVNNIRALEHGDSLIAVTDSGPFSIQASALNETITPTNIKAGRVSGGVGAADQMTEHVGQAMLVVERSTTQLYELVYRFDIGFAGGFLMPELTELARHIAAPGLGQILWQQNPYKVLWAWRADGVLAGMTYARDQDVVGWHPHPLGGKHINAMSVERPFGKVLSAAVIPGAVQDELWLVVERTINGQTRRYVEFMEDEFRPRTQDDKDLAWFVDCGLAFDGKQNATLTPGAGAAVKGQTEVIFTAGSAVFAASSVGKEIHYPYDLQVGRTLRTKRARALVTAFDSTVAVRATIVEPFPAAPAILPANAWRLTASTLSGLGHLEGETVQVLADGAVEPPQTVVGGAITLARQVGRAQVGLGYASSLETLNLEGLAKLAGRKRIANGAVKFLNTLGAKFGTSFDNLETIPFRKTTDPLDSSPPLFTGDKPVIFPGGFDTEARVVVTQDLPLPCTVVAIGLDMEGSSG